MANETSEDVIPSEFPKENQRTYFEQTLKPRVVDLNGYKYNNLKSILDFNTVEMIIYIFLEIAIFLSTLWIK